MKHWISKDSVKVKIGVALVLFVVGVGVTVAVHRPILNNTAQNETEGGARNVVAKVENVTEKPKIAVVETKIETIEADVPFSTTQTYDGTLPKDTQVVKVEGANGKKIVKTEVKTKDGVEISRQLISEDITVPPVAQVVAIGTKVVPRSQAGNKGNCNASYSPCVKVVGGVPDCEDIGQPVNVVNRGVDPLGLDSDGDGIACNSPVAAQ